MQSGQFRGIKIAKTAPSLTHALYANDVMIMGEGTVQEVTQFRVVLKELGDYSGLIVNPAKSVLWFSKRCTEETREEIPNLLQSKPATDTEKYLGIYITQQGA